MTGKIAFDKDVILRAAQKRALPDGWYRFVVKSAESKKTDKNHLMTVCQLVALKDPDDASSGVTPTVRNNFVWPFKNPDVEDHVPPNTGGMMARNMRALYGPEEVPEFPVRNKDTKELEYLGEVISADEEEAKRMEVVEKAFEKASAIAQDASILENESFYGRIQKEGDFSSLKDMQFELPSNAQLVDLDEVAAKAKAPPKKLKK